MHNIDALILVEHINRELESAVLLKVQLENRGYKVEIVSAFWDFGKAVIKYCPKIVITPWAYDDWEINLLTDIYGGYKDGQFDILNLHHEQMTYADAQAFMMPRGKARHCHHIAWGNYYKQLLIDEGIPSGHIKVTGSARLDLFSKRYWSLSSSKEELADKNCLDSTKKWVLVLGNFSFAYFTKEKLDGQYQRGNKAAYELAEESKYALNEITNWLEKLCEEIGGACEIIYRPHPSEDIKNEHILLQQRYNNFHVIKERTVRDWLINCDGAFMWNSTSSVEAAFADKPVYALRPRQLSSSLTIAMLEKVPIIKDYDGFSRVVSSIVNNNVYCNDEFKKSLANYYSQDYSQSTESTADYIEEIIKNGEHIFTSQFNRYSYKRLVLYIKQQVKNCLRKLGMLNNTKYKVQLNDYIDKETISRLEKAIRHCLDK